MTNNDLPEGASPPLQQEMTQMTTAVTFRTEAGATTSGQISWIAEIEVNGWLTSRGEFETPSAAWEWIYSQA